MDDDGKMPALILLCIAKHANNARGEPNRVITVGW